MHKPTNKYMFPRVAYQNKKERDLAKEVTQTFNNEVETLAKEIATKQTNLLISGILAITCISLRDEFGFGSKRLVRFVKKFNKQFDCILAGTVSMNDFINWYNEEIKGKLVDYSDD